MHLEERGNPLTPHTWAGLRIGNPFTIKNQRRISKYHYPHITDKRMGGLARLTDLLKAT